MSSAPILEEAARPPLLARVPTVFNREDPWHSEGRANDLLDLKSR